MRIYIDADACPVKQLAEKIAKEAKIPVTMITDVNHVLRSDYSEIITVSQGADSVDLVLINKIQRNDIVITQDYGVAALALGKGAYAIGNSGLIYTDDNINQLLFERFLGKKVRSGGKRCGKTSGPQKRTKQDDETFAKNFTELMKESL